MSSRVTTLGITIALAALAANSTVAYFVGREPALFAGPAYVVLLASLMVCATTWVLAERYHRVEVRERADDIRIAVAHSQWRLTDRGDSGSWRRPARD